MSKRTRITKKEQCIAAEILTAFMFVRDMDEMHKTWEHLYNVYELQDDPFTHCPCSIDDYFKLSLEHDRQTMIDRYGHCDGLD